METFNFENQRFIPIIFVLDQQRRFRLGTDYLSYTLNRVVN